jgi:hypothetical protein
LLNDLCPRTHAACLPVQMTAHGRLTLAFWALPKLTCGGSTEARRARTGGCADAYGSDAGEDDRKAAATHGRKKTSGTLFTAQPWKKIG